MLDILYEDNHLLIVNKPAGILTQPSGTAAQNLEDMAKEWIKAAYQKPGNVFLHAIHRIDKEVSGIVVFAKTSKALSRLMGEVREKHVRKLYLAWVEGTPAKEREELMNYLLHDKFSATLVDTACVGAKEARLFYQVKRSERGRSLLEVELITGRYHQIRAQLAHRGCPIVGDKKYGAKTLWEGPGIALHHVCFTIAHPTTKQLLTFTAPHPLF